MQIKRTVKTHIHWSINEVDPIILILQQIYYLTKHHRTICQCIQIVQNFITVPILGRFAPYSDIKHLQHPFFDVGQLIKINIIQPR